jgi:two-component system chemotaxis response regulator CheY
MSRVLIVDDSPTIRRMVKASLGQLAGGVEFAEAASGLDAIEQLALALPDLIVLDLNMPDMHGLEVLGFVRANPKFRLIPVMVLTTRGDDDSRQAALQAGATAYLTKPFTPAALAAQAALLLVPAAAPGAAQ